VVAQRLHNNSTQKIDFVQMIVTSEAAFSSSAKKQLRVKKMERDWAHL
jgi:hypothetical protein